MTPRSHTKLVHEGMYVAKVEVQLTDPEFPWGPYLSVADAEKLDAVRTALRDGDLATATRLATVYRLTPITAA